MEFRPAYGCDDQQQFELRRTGRDDWRWIGDDHRYLGLDGRKYNAHRFIRLAHQDCSHANQPYDSARNYSAIPGHWDIYRWKLAGPDRKRHMVFRHKFCGNCEHW